jgi:hypothetical protein
MEPEGSLSCSQEPVTGLYSEPDARPSARSCVTFRNESVCLR